METKDKSKQETKPADTKETKVAIIPDKNISDNVLSRVDALEKQGGLNFPANYSYANALKSAWLILQNTVDKEKRPVLQVCSKESIANSLLDMVIQGLSPAKKQCYFVAYGKQLSLMRSYMGTVAVTKRISGIEDVFGNVIYADDVFKYRINPSSGIKEIIEHTQEFKNISLTKIVGAYAVILRNGKPAFVEIMTIEQIKKAWLQGVAYSSGKSTAHNNFTDEMAKKTVLNRACKTFLNTSDDSDILTDAINRTTANEYVKEAEYEEEIENEIEENANKELLEMKPETASVAAEESVQEENLFKGNNEGPGF